jgi:hypothetical protein
VLDCEARLQGVRDNLAGRREEVKKRFCCVTTRGLNLGDLNGLRRSFGSLTSLSFGQGVPGSGVGTQAVYNLPAGRLPAPHLLQAFGILTITLVPAPRLILAPTSFAQTRPEPGPACSG